MFRLPKGRVAFRWTALTTVLLVMTCLIYFVGSQSGTERG
jgi:hypothetical protein